MKTVLEIKLCSLGSAVYPNINEVLKALDEIEGNKEGQKFNGLCFYILETLQLVVLNLK